MKIQIIGTGNVGTHLLKAFKEVGEKHTECINPRTLEGLTPDSDFIIISVSDRAVKEVADRIADILPLYHGIVAHTAGSVGIHVLPEKLKHKGVFYPMQTFSKETALDYSRMPFFIEGDSPETSKKLHSLAGIISGSVFDADSSLRKKLHIASVFACNFTNRMYALANKLLNEEGLDIRVLMPLIEETAAKLKRLSPAEGQTGPARRGDFKVMKSHLEDLRPDPEMYEIYKLISSSIYSEYNGKKPIQFNITEDEQDRL